MVIYMVDDRPGHEMALRLEGTQKECDTLELFCRKRGLKKADQKEYERILRKANR